LTCSILISKRRNKPVGLIPADLGAPNPLNYPHDQYICSLRESPVNTVSFLSAAEA